MCNNESLQQKAYKTAIFHISLSLFGVLLLIHHFLNPESNDFVYKEICNETTIYSNGSLRHHLMQKYKSMVENGCKKGIIISLLAPLILLIDLSLNLLLLHGVRKRSNAHFAHWLVGQGVRILSCVIFICLFMTLYGFDTSRNTEGTADNDIEKIETFSSNSEDM
jgi:hypothetical protein